MKTEIQTLFLVAPFAVAACSDPASPDNINPEDVAATETDGLSSASAGETEGDTDSGSGGGDATGSGEPQPVQGGCLFSDEQAEELNVYGYRYQCKGFFEYQIRAGNTEETIRINYGEGIEGESYEEPRVMACCPAYAEGYDCEQPHSQACMVDLVEQGCKSIVYELNAEANKSIGARKEALLKAANHVAENQEACFEAFAVKPGLFVDQACDKDNTSVVEYDRVSVGASWTFDPPGIIPEVTIEILDSELQDIFPWFGDPGFPGESCTSSEENDHMGLLELDPTDPVFELKYGSAEVRGDGVIDKADLDSEKTACGEHCSAISITEDPILKTAEINWMLALGRQNQIVDGVQVEKFRAELQGPIHAVSDGDGSYKIEAGDALFALSGSTMGGRAIVYAPNKRAMYFRPGKSGRDWNVDPIQLVYENPAESETFEFFIGATVWE